VFGCKEVFSKFEDGREFRVGSGVHNTNVKSEECFVKVDDGVYAEALKVLGALGNNGGSVALTFSAQEA
jgi:hypothetical protein